MAEPVAARGPDADRRARRRHGAHRPRRDASTSTPTGAWDLDALAASYAEWLDAADDLVVGELGRHDDEDEAMFAARFHLVHEWRKFLFTDPGLPGELLPARWPGQAAAELSTSEATRLEPGADRFVARCLAG